VGDRELQANPQTIEREANEKEDLETKREPACNT